MRFVNTLTNISPVLTRNGIESRSHEKEKTEKLLCNTLKLSKSTIGVVILKSETLGRKYSPQLVGNPI